MVCFLELRPVATCTTLPSTAGILFKGKYWIIYFLTQETEGCDHTLSTKLYQHFCFFSKRWVDREWFKLILQPCLEFSIFLALFTPRILLTLLIRTVCRICITYEHNNGLAHYRVLYSLAFEHWNMEAKGQGFDSSCGLFVPCSWWDDKHLSTRNAPFGSFWYHSYGRSSPSSNGFSKKLGNVWLHAMQGRFWCGNELNFFFWNEIINFGFVP